MSDSVLVVRSPNGEDNAHINEHFPYSYGAFTTMKTWIETRRKMGQRIVSQCRNVHLNKWTDRKVSAYHDIAFVVLDPTTMIAEPLLINFSNLTDQQLLDLAMHYPMDEFQLRQFQDYISSLTQKVFIPNWANYTPSVAGFHAARKIELDPRYHTSRAIVVKQSQAAPEPMPSKPMESKPLVHEDDVVVQERMPTTVADLIVNHVVKQDAELIEKFRTMLNELGARSSYTRIQGEARTANEARLRQLEQSRKLKDETVNQPPHPDRVAALQRVGYSWDAWCARERETFEQYEKLVRSGIALRNQFLLELNNQVSR